MNGQLGCSSWRYAFTQFNSTLALMDVTGMQKRKYADTEEFLSGVSERFM